MKCPNDNTEMHQVKIESHYGQPIFLDQCKECGGIWFDEMELFSARHGEAEKIEVFDSKGLWSPTNMEKRALKCPLDQSELFQFKDRYFPKGIILERCPLCNGIWLNRGEFTRFQHTRQELRRSKERSSTDKKLEGDIKRILSEHHSEGAGNTSERLGRFLSTPVDRVTLLPLEQSEKQMGQGETANLILNIFMLILRAVIFRR